MKTSATATLPAADAEPAPAAVQAAVPAAVPATCTLATPLVPGVPGSPGHLIPSAINPNGQSELSGVMRLMQADLKAARTAIEHGEPIVAMAARHAKLRCAWPTRPADRDQRFDENAQVYLAAVTALEAAPKSNAVTAFEQVLGACRSCHEQTCSGALSAISALRLAPMSSEP